MKMFKLDLKNDHPSNKYKRQISRDSEGFKNISREFNSLKKIAYKS